MQPSTLVTIALGICLMGILWRIGRWFRSAIGPEGRGLSTGRRVVAAARAIGAAVFSPRLFRVAGAFLWEVLFLGRLLGRHPLRWGAHMMLSYGFLLLVFFHALDDWITPVCFADYVSTQNPFRWLRNLMALLVLIGLLVAIVRQRRRTDRAFDRSPGDRLLLLLVATITVSGVLLEGAQILSPVVFDEMVEEYMGDDDPQEVADLRHYWSTEFGTLTAASANRPSPGDLAAGQSAHEAYCASCHARPQTAFLSYPASRVLQPVVQAMGGVRIDLWLWHLHFWSACLALACLPFSKLFHLLATPINLLARTADPSVADAALQPTRRAIGLDACTHCGLCSQHCSVAPIYGVIRNTTILPSEKLRSVKKMVFSADSGKAILAEGSFICTLCGKCTQWCPSGIDLQDLWQATRTDLRQSGLAPFPGRAASCAPPSLAVDAPVSLGLTDRPETFWACVQCTTCTSVCPVVALSEDPRRDLDLTPQQIMNLMRLQLKDQAMGSRMLWECVTCYKCQEHCPQDVKVADVLYELRNEAWRRRPPSVTAGLEGSAHRRIR